MENKFPRDRESGSLGILLLDISMGKEKLNIKKSLKQTKINAVQKNLISAKI